MARSFFVKIRCTDCGNEQVAFSRAASRVNCSACSTTLVHPTGGEAKFTAEIIAKLD